MLIVTQRQQKRSSPNRNVTPTTTVPTTTGSDTFGKGSGQEISGQGSELQSVKMMDRL